MRRAWLIIKPNGTILRIAGGPEEKGPLADGGRTGPHRNKGLLSGRKFPEVPGWFPKKWEYWNRGTEFCRKGAIMSGILGKSGKQPYFEGWYIKHQNEDRSIALIPSFHREEGGRKSASLQVITEDQSFRLGAGEAEFRGGKRQFHAELCGAEFSEKGCRLQVREKGIWLEGKLNYGQLTPLKSDIMGPFQFVPGMQCSHRVYSLTHRVDGRLSLNGKEYVFRDGTGYIEGDRGHSFPEAYLWTQYNDRQVSVMASAAKIPAGKFSFLGCIGVIWIKGQEYRLGTYLGAKVIYADAEKLIIRQKDTLFSAELLEGKPQALRAPDAGAMTRMIRENVACRVHHQLIRGGKILLDFTSARASFEADGTLFS